MLNQTKPQNKMSKRTSDRNVETAGQDSFPASDPSAGTAGQGARAVPPQRMMDGADDGRATPADSVTVDAHFRNHEAAKLALESLVREGPLDRRHAEILPGDDAVTLRFQSPPGDAERLGDLVRKQGGAEA